MLNLIIFTTGMLLAYDLREAATTIKNGFKAARLNRENECLKSQIFAYERMLK